jgi:hypothetical protein
MAYLDIDTIKLYSDEVGLGETLRFECPRCNDGSRDLSISRTIDGTVLYQCFHASCPIKGVIGVGQWVAPSDGPPKPKKRRVWEGVTHALPQDVLKWIEDTWGLKDPPNWYYTEDYGGRIAMSIRSPKDTHRGWVLRNDGSRKPKAITYVNEGEEGISWAKTNPHTGTILVEDIPSLLRASRYMNGVSLCGTGVGDSRASEIAKYATRPIILALDQDATSESFRWAKKYSLLWDDVKVLPLKQDIKDMQEDDLCTLLTGLSSY